VGDNPNAAGEVIKNTPSPFHEQGFTIETVELLSAFIPSSSCISRARSFDEYYFPTPLRPRPSQEILQTTSGAAVPNFLRTQGVRTADARQRFSVWIISKLILLLNLIHGLVECPIFSVMLVLERGFVSAVRIDSQSAYHPSYHNIC
jgi:hypothetical protein